MASRKHWRLKGRCGPDGHLNSRQHAISLDVWSAHATVAGNRVRPPMTEKQLSKRRSAHRLVARHASPTPMAVSRASHLCYAHLVMENFQKFSHAESFRKVCQVETLNYKVFLHGQGVTTVITVPR
jgi:hypothetical protein